ASFVRRHHGCAGCLLNVREDRSYLARRLPRLIHETLYLMRDDSEALAVLAGLCSLDRCVYRKQVRLRCDVIHHGDNLADRLTLFAQANHASGDDIHLLTDTLDASHY